MVWIAPPARVGIDARTDNGDDNCARAWRHRRRLLRKFRLAGLVCVLMLAWTALTFARVFAAFEAPVQDRHIAAAAQKKGGSEAEQREESEEGRSTWRRLGATTPNDVAPAVESTTAASSLGRWLVDEMTTEGDDQEATNNSSSDACDQSALAKGGGWLRVVLLVAAILFAFNGIAIVCDEFFQASLEKISEVLKLTPDVAGATFLAAGSSAPELFTAIADVFGPSNSIGVGTIVGSAMFNILVIVALSAAVAVNAGLVSKVDHRVVARDVTFYMASIFTLVGSAIDGKITWWEALIMVLEYSLYILFMVYNSEIIATCSPSRVAVLSTTGDADVESPKKQGELKDSKDPPQPDNASEEAQAGGDLSAEDKSGEEVHQGEGDEGGGHHTRRQSSSLNRIAARALRVSFLNQERQLSGAVGKKGSAEDDSMRAAAATAAAAVVSAVLKESMPKPTATEGVAGNSPGNPGSDAAESTAGLKWACEASGFKDRLEWPEGNAERFLFIFGLPFTIAISLTVPDCSRPLFEDYYIVTFIMSIAWISVISSYMVLLATAVACILGVSAIVMGVLVLAVGTSVPDMIGSMIAAKNGEASMAIANAIGSNVFNILLGLGGPWLVSSLVYGKPTEVDQAGATKSLIILFGAVVMFVGSLIISQWQMNKTLAYTLLITYIIYVIYTIVSAAFF